MASAQVAAIFDGALVAREINLRDDRERERERARLGMEAWNKSGIIGKHDGQIDDCYRLASRVVTRTGSKERTRGRENDGTRLARGEGERKPCRQQIGVLTVRWGDNYLSGRLARRSSVARRSTLAPRARGRREKERERARQESGAVNCRLSRARSDRDHCRRGIASSKPARERR